MPEQESAQNQTITELTTQVRELSAQVKKLRRRLVYASLYEWLKFFIIVVPSIYFLWRFWPQLEQMSKTWSMIQQNAASMGNPSSPEQQQALDKLKSQYPQLFK